MPDWSAPGPSDGELVVVPLTSRVLELDLAAYRSSPRAIEAHSAGRWPGPGLSRAEARRLLAIHEEEHARDEAYAYAILDASGAHEIGCVYLRPLAAYLARTGTVLDVPAADASGAAILTFWLIDDDLARPAAAQVLAGLRRWLFPWPVELVHRCLPEEEATVAALAVAPDLVRLTARDQELPYLWFRDRSSRPHTQ